jgi:hypothetical protein
VSVLADRAESRPARLRVRPATPADLRLDGTACDQAHGVWINVAADVPELALSRFDFHPVPRVRTLRAFGPVPRHARPAVEGMRVAWIDGDTRRSSDGRAIKLPAGDARLVSPDLAIVDASLVAGAARLALEEPPAWIDAHGRTAVWMQRDGLLVAAAWNDRAFERPRRLHSWDGPPLAAGSTLDARGRVHGAFLRAGPEIVAWTLESGAVRETYRRAVPWPADAVLDRAIVRVSGTGVGAALLRADDGRWFLDGRALDPAIRPLDVGFAAGTRPVVIGSAVERGFTLHARIA